MKVATVIILSALALSAQAQRTDNLGRSISQHWKDAAAERRGLRDLPRDERRARHREILERAREAAAEERERRSAPRCDAGQLDDEWILTAPGTEGCIVSLDATYYPTTGSVEGFVVCSLPDGPFRIASWTAEYVALSGQCVLPMRWQSNYAYSAAVGKEVFSVNGGGFIDASEVTLVEACDYYRSGTVILTEEEIDRGITWAPTTIGRYSETPESATNPELATFRCVYHKFGALSGLLVFRALGDSQILCRDPDTGENIGNFQCIGDWEVGSEALRADCAFALDADDVAAQDTSGCMRVFGVPSPGAVTIERAPE